MYRPGKQLVEADAVSRYPCLGPRIMSDEGKMAALKTLFGALPKQWDLGGRTWIHTGKDTQLAREIMLNYQASCITAGKQDSLPSSPSKTEKAKRVPLTDNPSETKIANLDYGFAVFAPYADAVTKILDAALQ